MTGTEYLLTCIAEECAEIGEQAAKVAVRAAKCLRFGLDETQSGQLHTNQMRLWAELADLMALGEVALELGIIQRDDLDRKKAKLETFMAYSRKLGTLKP
jgi:hypothetical protein